MMLLLLFWLGFWVGYLGWQGLGVVLQDDILLFDDDDLGQAKTVVF